MKFKNSSAFLFSFIFMMLLNTAVFADSSWHWITTSPMPVLPFAVVFTIAIETFVIFKFAHVKNTFKVFSVVCVSNLFSFLISYVYLGLRDISGGMKYTIDEIFNKGPSYIITLRYLILTLIVEIPIVYFFLRKNVANKKRLIIVVAIANTITTLLVAITEHIICKGSW